MLCDAVLELRRCHQGIRCREIGRLQRLFAPFGPKVAVCVHVHCDDRSDVNYGPLRSVPGASFVRRRRCLQRDRGSRPPVLAKTSARRMDSSISILISPGVVGTSMRGESGWAQARPHFERHHCPSSNLTKDGIADESRHTLWRNGYAPFRGNAGQTQAIGTDVRLERGSSSRTIS